MKFRASSTWISRNIAQRLLVLQDGDMHDPDTWVRVVGRLGLPIEFEWDPDATVGEYVTSESGSGTIYINTYYSPAVQARGLVHEIAHGMLNILASSLNRGEVPGFLAGEWERAGYDDDPKDIRHQIACEVERICFGGK